MVLVKDKRDNILDPLSAVSGIIERRYGDLYMLQDKKDNTNKPATWAVWSDSEPNNETRHSIAIRAIKERLDRAQPGQ